MQPLESKHKLPPVFGQDERKCFANCNLRKSKENKKHGKVFRIKAI